MNQLHETTSKKFHWDLALLFSATVATLNMLNNSRVREFHDFSRLTVAWVLAVLYLLLLWWVNFRMPMREPRKSNLQRYLRRFSINVLLTGAYLVVSYLLMTFLFDKTPALTNTTLLGVRALIGIALVWILQYALEMSSWHQQALLQNERLKTENIRSQFELLKQQVNPHFLFNALSTLRSMIHTQHSNSEQYVLKLSEIYRQLLKQRDQDTVTLQEELDFLDAYLFMLQSRFGQGLNVSLQILPTAHDVRLPTFGLQILIENCVKHNVISTIKPLFIKIYQENVNEITVENNLQPKQSESTPSGYGLPNLAARYELLGIKNGVRIEQTEQAFKVHLQLIMPI